MVTKNWKKGLFLFHTGALVVYKPHGYLWVQLFLCIFLFFRIFFFLFVPTLRRVGFASALLPYGQWVVLDWGRVADVTRTQTRSFTWTVCVCVCVVLDPETWSANGVEAWKAGFFFSFWIFFFWKWKSGVQGCITFENRGADMFSPPPSQALTPCPHQLTYALLFIQAVRYHFGDGSTINNRRIATTWT